MFECNSHADLFENEETTGVYYVREAKDMAYITNGKYHRLDGPAVHVRDPEDYDFDSPDEYYINGKMYDYNDYWTHPLVVMNRVNTILDFDV